MEDPVEQARLMGSVVQAVVLVVVILGVYVFFAWLLAKIAERIGMPFKSSLILALIPIANLVLLVQMAAKPMWWILLLVIPYINLVFVALVWGAIAKRRGKSAWWGLGMLVPFVNLVLMLILAFEKSDQGLRPTSS
ncbi:MAG: DUF805 domain-containing protein [Deltaproteobacteria bacterium]|nr:DUF805 domain-containing protein [Deltaproteobacteria bacterium]